MNRNPLIPFALIGVFGLGLMFLLSFVGLGNMDEVAQGGDEAPQQDTASATPEELYQQSCIGCHGADYTGGAGPSLIGVGDKYSSEEIQDIIKNGKGIMQGGLIPNDRLEDMAAWLMELN